MGSTRWILANFDSWADRQLGYMGLEVREVQARKEKTPAKILKIISSPRPDQHHGFGIGGDIGGGKTMAMSVWLREYLRRGVNKAAEAKQGFEIKEKIVWSSWPHEVSVFRANATGDATYERLQDILLCDLLFLDDLGRERVKGTYADDWAASQLDLIINHRYRAMLPIIWTTNITEPDLLGLYGSAMLSRLTADNPLIWIDGLMDMRG